MATARALRLRRWLIGLAVVLTLPLVAWAQPAPLIEWRHDGLNVTAFTCQIDTGAQVSLGIPSKVGDYYSTALSNCGTITAGAHQLYIYACNTAGCTAAATLYVVKL